MANEKKWWSNWIAGVVAILTVVTFICGGFAYLYHEFVTKESHRIVMEQNIKQYTALKQETVKQFSMVNKEMRRDDLKDSYNKLYGQKYDIIKRLSCTTLEVSAKLELEQDLEKTRDRLLIISAELKTLRAELE